MKKLIIFAIAIAAFAACKSNPSPTNNTSNANTPANLPKAGNPAEPAQAANANKPDNAAKPESNAPKRITFAKGATESTETVTLAPGATAQFILGATGAQTLFITPDNDKLTFRTVRGIAGELVRADDGTFSAETKGNNAARGDIVFEVKNPTKSAIKAKLTIAIEDFGD